MSEYHPTNWRIEAPVVADAEPIAQMVAESWVATYSRPGQTNRNQEVAEDAAAFLLPERVALRESIIARVGNNPTEEFMRIAKTKSEGEVIG